MRLRAVGTAVALHEVETVHGDEEPIAAGVLDAQQLVGDAAHVHHNQAAVGPDAVIGVDQEVARRELAEAFESRPFLPRTALPGSLALSEDLLFGDDCALLVR